MSCGRVGMSSYFYGITRQNGLISPYVGYLGYFPYSNSFINNVVSTTNNFNSIEKNTYNTNNVSNVTNNYNTNITLTYNYRGVVEGQEPDRGDNSDKGDKGDNGKKLGHNKSDDDFPGRGTGVGNNINIKV